MSNRIDNAQVAELLSRQVAPVSPRPTEKSTEFQDLLGSRLKLSGHAQTRMQSRNIQLEASQWDRVMGGVERAAAKGGRESLLMIDDVALIVSIKNRTIITAVDKAHLSESVFTNIDSAVIV